jgi:hypothetical protein
MFGKRKQERLQEAIATARTALAGTDEPQIEAAYDELRTAYFDLGFDFTDAEAQELLETFRTRSRQRAERQLQQTLTACPCCGSGELLVADHASLDDLYVENARTPFRFSLVCCTACGDLRFWTRDIAAMRRLATITDNAVFKEVSVPARAMVYR